jgi:hypothetical protein
MRQAHRPRRCVSRETVRLIMASVRDFPTKQAAEGFRTALANSHNLASGKTDCWLFPITGGYRVFIPDAGNGAAHALQAGAVQIDDTEPAVRAWLERRVSDIDRQALTADGTAKKP